MPPKKQASVSSIAINTISTNKFRSNAASDLVTKSQAALSSQASVLKKTQTSQGSQYTNFNFSMGENDDMQFKREEMSEVRISLNLEDEQIIGFKTLERKEKLDIKNVQNKFIADPTFERTQKMFDSFSLKSLMLNIFEISTQLDVRIFMKSDLELQKLKQNQKDRISQDIIPQNPQIKEDYVNKQQEYDQVKSETATDKFLIENPYLNDKNGNDPLPYYLLKHIEVSKGLMDQNNFLDQIQNFIAQQPQLKEDYISRNLNLKKPNRMEVDEDPSQNLEDPSQDLEDLTYGQILERQKQEFYEIMKQFQGIYDQDQSFTPAAFYDFPPLGKRTPLQSLQLRR